MSNKPEFLVRRNSAVFGILGLAAAGLSGAFLVRGEGSLDAVLGVVLAVIAATHLFALVGARAPLLVADEEGVRMRVGTSWVGVPWSQIRQVVVEEADSVLRDGRIVVQPRDGQALEGLGVLGRMHLVWSRRWYGAPLSVPLALTTTTNSDDVIADLVDLAHGRTDVVALHGRHLASLAEVPARIGALVSRLGHGQAHDVDTIANRADSPAPAPARVAGVIGADAPLPAAEAAPEAAAEKAPVPAAAPVSPLREPVRPTRAEVTREVPASPGRSQTPETAPPLAPKHAAVVAEDPGSVIDPVIGPVLRKARERVRLSIDELSERTRIRPHVLEAIEVDDFESCGGDFYARGHLTTLARALGLDLEPLMRDYDERYAHGPINARRVFEAELATGLSGGMRATVGGPTWSLLIAAVLCLMLVWGVARLFSDPPAEVVAPGSVDPTAGLASNREPITSAKMKTRTMTVTASFASSRVVVKDRTGRVLWSGNLVQGDRRKVAGLAPFTVEADNAGAVEVQVLGKQQGTIGLAGAPGSKKFG